MVEPIRYTPADATVGRVARLVELGHPLSRLAELTGLPREMVGDLAAGRHRSYPDRPPVRWVPAPVADLVATVELRPSAADTEVTATLDLVRPGPTPGTPLAPPGEPVDGARHGTLTGYTGDGCRCPDCRAASAEYQRTRYYGAGRPSPNTEREPRHGTLAGYKKDGCRCDDCRAANAEYQREYQRGRFRKPVVVSLPR